MNSTTPARAGLRPTWLCSTLLLITTALMRPALAAEPPIVRIAISPDADILVGQQLRLNLDLLAADGWANLATPPQLTLPGAWLMRVESQGTRLAETIDGVSYSGQRYQWLLFPQRGGAFTLPATPLKVSIKTFGADATQQQQTLRTQPLNFSASAPPGSESLPAVISTTSVTASQQWQPDTSTVKLGDGIRRRITLQADGIAGMAFPPLQFAGIDGLTLYPGQPEVKDRINRGTLESGQRIESVSYVPQRPGQFQLPAISIHWWDTGSAQLREQTLPGLSVTVSAAADGSTATPQGSDASLNRYWPALALLLAAALLATLWWRYGRPRWQHWRSQQQAIREHSEAAHFERFIQAANSADPAATLNALMQWLERSGQAGHPAQIDHFLARFGDAGTQQSVTRLLRTLNAESGSDWQPATLIDTLGRARQRWLQSQTDSHGDQPRLPPLNPAKTQGAQ